MDNFWTDADTPSYYTGGENSGLPYQDPMYSFDNLAGMQDWKSLGFTGDTYNQIGQGQDAYSQINPDLKDWIGKNGYSLKGGLDGNTLWSGLFQNGKMKGATPYDISDNEFGLAAALAMSLIPGAQAGAALGLEGTLGQVVGSTAMGAISGGVANGDPVKGALSGFTGNEMQGLNPAGVVGIESPTLAKIFNNGVGSAVGAAATGGNPLQAGLMSAGTTGLNSLGSLFNSGNGMDNGPVPGDVGLSYDTKTGNLVDSGFNGVPGNPNMQKMSASSGGDTGPSWTLPSINMGNVGSFIGNHFGDLASTLYGIYNNRKQASMLKDYIGGLTGLYSPNGAYATQLRNTLERKDAAAGRRSDYAGRETQLMASLADRAAQLSPQLFAMQNGVGQLNNQLGMNLFNSFNKMGGFKSLQDLFRSNNFYPSGGANITGLNNGYGSDIVFNNWGG